MTVRKRPDEITITVTATARKENRRMRARRLCIVTWGVGEGYLHPPPERERSNQVPGHLRVPPKAKERLTELQPQRMGKLAQCGSHASFSCQEFLPRESPDGSKGSNYMFQKLSQTGGRSTAEAGENVRGRTSDRRLCFVTRFT